MRPPAEATSSRPFSWKSSWATGQQSLESELARELEFGLAQLEAAAAEIAVGLEREDGEVLVGEHPREDVDALEVDRHLAQGPEAGLLAGTQRGPHQRSHFGRRHVH